jgi:RNA polymerase sigma factor (sigma-70 family)
VSKQSDADLVVLARAGDKAAFGQLIERYQPLVKGIALNMVRHEGLAQELMQETMLQAYLSLEHLRDNRRFKSWLYGIALNVCKSYLRAQKLDFFSLEALMGGMRFEGPLLFEAPPHPERVAEERELHRLVMEAINSLSPKNRRAILLFYYEQFTIREIATLLGVSVVAVKGRLHKSRRQLRASLLPLYTEINQIVSTPERSTTMIKVTVVDVVDAADVRQDEDDKAPFHGKVIILLDETDRRFLPIWVGPFEGDSIALTFVDYPFKRPLTYTFVAHLLEGAGVELEEVWVETLKDDTFYAIAKIRSGETVSEIDARPSDAINLALLMNSPIYVAEAVMAQAGVDISDKDTVPAGLGVKLLEEKAAKMRQETEEKKQRYAQRTDEEKAAEMKQTQQKLVALVLGSEEEVG